MREMRTETRGVEPESETTENEIAYEEGQEHEPNEHPRNEPQTGRLPARASRRDWGIWW